MTVMTMFRGYYVIFLSLCVQLFLFGAKTESVPKIPTSIVVEDNRSREILQDDLYLLVGRTVVRAQYQFMCKKSQSKLSQSNSAESEPSISDYKMQTDRFTIYLVSSCDNTKVDNKAGSTFLPYSTMAETSKCLRTLFKDEECYNDILPLDYIKLQEWLSTLLWNDRGRNITDISFVTVFPPGIFRDRSSKSFAATDLHLIVSDPSLYSTNGVDWNFSNANVVFETNSNCNRSCSMDLEPGGRVVYFNDARLDVTSPLVTGSYWRCVVRVKYYLRNQDVALILKIIHEHRVWTRRLTVVDAWKEHEEHIGGIKGIFIIQLQLYRNQQQSWKIGKLQSAIFENCHLPSEPAEKPVPGPKNGTFVCRTGVTIGSNKLCDFHKDCFHGDDESEELCGDRFSLGLCDFEGKEVISQCPFILSDYFENTSTLIPASMTKALTTYAGSFEGHILAYEEHHSARRTGFVTVNLTNHESYLSDNKSCQFQLDAYLSASVRRFLVRIIDSQTKNTLETYDKRLENSKWQIYQLRIPDFSERNVTLFYMEVFAVLSKGEFMGLDKIYISPDCIFKEPVETSLREHPKENRENRVVIIVIITVASVAIVWTIVLLLLHRRYIHIKRSGEAGRRFSLFGGRARSLKRLPDSAPLLRRLNDNLCQDHPNFLMYKEILTQDLNDDIKNLSRYKLKLTNVLGSGAFGEVLQGQLIKGAFLKHVAVKRLSHGCSEKERTDFLVEALTMSKFKHDNIVCCLGIYVKNGSLLLVEELMAGGDLKRFLIESRPTVDETPALSVDELLSLANDICQACSYLEMNKFIHRDIASRNCLLTTKTSDRVVKMADFGLARDIIRNDSYKKCGRSMLPVRWLPPESYLEGLFTTKSDVWAYGILLWEIFSFGYDPYPGMKCEEMMAKVNGGQRMEAPPLCPTAIYDVMMLCWQHDPKSRPSFQRLCEYIQKIRKNVYISIGSFVSDDENNKENSDDYGNKLPNWQCNGNYAIEEESV